VGAILHARKDLVGATAKFEKALALDPKYAMAHHGLGHVLSEKNDLEGALREYKTAIDLKPNYALFHRDLGYALLYGKKDVEGAIQEFKKAIALDGELASAHYNLGNALSAKKYIHGAIACFKQTIALNNHAELVAMAHCNLGHELRRLGQFAEALKSLKMGHALGSKIGSDWKYPSAQWVQQCEALLALDQKLAAIQQGQAQPASAAEQLNLAILCRKYKKQYAAAAKFYTGAFAAAPKLADDLTKSDRYNAACAAALAAAGQGQDAGPLDAAAKAKWRQQALAWLKADLQLWHKQAQSGQPAALQDVMKTLSHWQTDPDLASVRDAKALKQLPQTEATDWQTLWADVNKSVQQIKK
jgi:tetratricopeptide (TPR) repeat protein